MAQWVSCFATNRKLVGSNSAGVNGKFMAIIILPNSQWAWGSNEPLTELSIRNISTDKDGRYVTLITCRHPVPSS